MKAKQSVPVGRGLVPESQPARTPALTPNPYLHAPSTYLVFNIFVSHLVFLNFYYFSVLNPRSTPSLNLPPERASAPFAQN